jgi:hypothetical protein
MMRFSHIGLCGVVTLVGWVSVFGQTPNPLTLNISDPRPLARAAEQLQQVFGVPINYEDPRYEHSDDVVDVTNDVARNAPAGTRVIVPRGGGVKVSVEVPAVTNNPARSAADFQNALSSVLQAYTSAGYATEYQAESVNGMLYITPKRMRMAVGGNARVESVMLTPITFSFQERSGAETLDLIVEALSKTCGYKVQVGVAPVGALLQTRLALGASAQPARDVLARLFAGLTKNGQPALAYHLYFDPQMRFYMLNIRPVPFTPAASKIGANTDETNSQNSHWVQR